ncbi:MAG: arginine--tRNA ligase [Planctomycetia bacterium]|nr:arginine--tRNA ligase [Planctomycetia bacterium]
MNLITLLQDRLRLALTGLVDDPSPYAAMLKAANDPKHGDYQANCAMSLAKALGKKPPEVAKEIVARLPQDDLFEKVEIAGPGFINLRFRTEWLAAQMQAIALGDRLGITPAVKPKTYVIDFSGPNVAKPLHVGHLRSTIIGDSLCRLLRFLGHKVIGDNHLGDWGLQFGMLLHGYKHHRDDAALQGDPVRELARVYVMLRKKIKPAEDVEDEPANAKNYPPDELAESQAVLAACRQETSKLHAGDPENLKLWKQFMPWAMAEIEAIYKRLDVKFDETLGESHYHSMLADVVRDLRAKGIAQESRGAIAILFGENQPAAIIQSSHGAYTYTTTDLATIRYRVERWNPDEILYVVDFRQALHFQHVYDAARRWGYDQPKYHHVSFGSVLDPKSRKPFKTSEGGAATLEELLNEAVQHAAKMYVQICEERRQRGDEIPELSPGELKQVHEAVGIGAVKYADLCQNRESDYVFSLEKMTSLEGNTATYMQNAYVRNRGIFRKGDENSELYRTHPPPVLLGQPKERALALQLLRFEDALQSAVVDYRPNNVTAYLWDLAKSYSGFYEECPVLKAETPALRQSRLLLCDLTARTIQKGLELLGIRTIERM